MKTAPSSARTPFLVASLLLCTGLSFAADRVSENALGDGGNAASTTTDITPDGKFSVFHSASDNLVVGDSNSDSDVFVYERSTGELTLVATNSTGTQTAAASTNGSISNDGVLVAFEANANDLVTGEDDDSLVDIYVKNLLTDEIEIASIANAGSNPNADCFLLGLSGNGQFVLFTSAADNLVTGDTNTMPDLFVRDLVNDTTVRASLANGGAELTVTGPNTGSISDDGSLVVFATENVNVVADDFNASTDVFVHTVGTTTTERISLDFLDGESDADSNNPVIAGNGLYVAFDSIATDLVDGDVNGERDVFIRDLVNGVTQIVSLTTNRSQVDLPSSNPTISGNGRFVGFSSTSGDFDSRYSGVEVEGFFKDLQTNSVELANITQNQKQGNGTASVPFVSSNGALAFDSDSNNLVTGDNESQIDAFYTKPKTPKIVVNKALKAAFKKKIKKAKIAFRNAKKAGKTARAKKLKRKIKTLRKKIKKL